MATLPEITDFLKQYPPFAELSPESLDQLSKTIEVEFHLAGQTIFSKGEEPLQHLRVIRAGAVEVVSNGQVLDQIGVGEMFGHASMLSGLPTGFEARAAEDTLTYLFPSDVAAKVLAEPRALRYMTKLILEDRHNLRSRSLPAIPRDHLREPVQSAIRTPPIICSPDTPIREAAEEMTFAGASAFIVNLGDSVGIVTDSDVRSRVVAKNLSGDTPVSQVMTAPAFTVPSDRLGSEVLLDMLDRGVRHFPVSSANGRIIGIVEDHDLVAVEGRSSFLLRKAVARAKTIDELVAVSLKLRPTVIAMSHGGVSALDITSVFSVVADALTRRALDFAVEQAGDAPTRFTWLALGSQARREALPSSDLDSAVAWFDEGDPKQIHEYFATVTANVTATLSRCGFRPDEHMASASSPLFVRPLSLWQREAHSFMVDPTQEKALILTSVLVDSRPVWGVETEPLISPTFHDAPAYPHTLHLLAQLALAHRPPVGFLRGHVIDFAGESRNRLDLKSAAVLPITDLARWAGLCSGVTCASTTTRISAARDAGKFTTSDAQNLQAAFELVLQLRLGHQVVQMEADQQPDDAIDPHELSSLTRSYLKEAFRAIASVQRRVANELAWAD